MGLTRAAAKLGLGVMKISSCWMSTAGAGMELSKGKSIYLCFIESSFRGRVEYTSQVVRTISLKSHEYEDEVEEDEFELREAAYNTSEGLIEFSQKLCNRLYLGCFTTAKHDVALGEVNSQLYCINNDNRFHLDLHSLNFEFFSPGPRKRWLPLARPPFIRGKFWPHYGVAYLDETKKIIGWELDKPVAFCFDVTMPIKGWTEVPLAMGNHRRPFFVHNHDPDIGDFHLMFSFDPDSRPLVVSAFFMSNNFDYIQPIINNPIQLPPLCSEYLVSTDDVEIESYFKDAVPTISSDFEFVNLGQKVGLVLHNFFENHREQGTNTGIILVITFEYEIMIHDSKPTLEIQTQLPQTLCFRYHTEQLRRREYYPHTCCPLHKKDLSGAFLL